MALPDDLYLCPMIGGPVAVARAFDVARRAPPLLAALLGAAVPAGAAEAASEAPGAVAADGCAAVLAQMALDSDRLHPGFRAAFADFDVRFRAFSWQFERSFADGAADPDRQRVASLAAATDALLLRLGRMLPLRDGGNDAWPMKFLIESISGDRVSLPQLDSFDRDEAERAAFLRLMLKHARQRASVVRFLSRFEMTHGLLGAWQRGEASASDRGALRQLAGGALRDSFRQDFRAPAERVLDDGWHLPLAARLHGELRRMCEEARME